MIVCSVTSPHSGKNVANGSKATGRTISWRASPLILNVRPFLSLRFGGKNFAEHSKYALLLYKPDATRAAIGALSEIQLAEALMDLVSAPDTVKRHAYIRNLVRKQKEGSTLNHSRLDPLGQSDRNSNDNSSEESENELQISVGFDGTVKHKKIKKSRRER